MSVTAASAASAVIGKAASVPASGAIAITKALEAASSAIPSASAAATVTNDALVNGFATLLGALIGGYVASHVAYKLQVRAAQKKERENGLQEAHQLMFCIIQQINTILLIWLDHFGEHVRSPGRFMNVPATTPFDVNRHVLDVAKVSILLDCKEGRAVLYDLNIAQEAYREALSILNERARVHRDSLQPALDGFYLGGQEVAVDEMMERIGERLTLTMVGMTDGAYVMLHKSFMKLAAVKEKARGYIVERFKTDDFTQISFPKTNGIETPPPQHYASFSKTNPKTASFGFGTAFNWCRLWPTP